MAVWMLFIPRYDAGDYGDNDNDYDDDADDTDDDDSDDDNENDDNFIPRSPEFLVTQGRLEEAKTSLQWFRGGAGADVEKELKEIENTVDDRRRAGVIPVSKLVTQARCVEHRDDSDNDDDDARYVKPLGIVLVLMALQQLSGINYILGYSTLIMEVIDLPEKKTFTYHYMSNCLSFLKKFFRRLFDSHDSHSLQSAGSSLGECVSTMLLGTVQVLGSVATTFLIDKFGRKILLIISEVFICISMLGVAVFFLLYEQCGECSERSGNNTTTTTTTTVLPELMISKSTVDNLGFLPLVSLMLIIDNDDDDDDDRSVLCCS